MTEKDLELQDLRREVEKLKEGLKDAETRANFWKVNAELCDMEIKQLRSDNAAYRAKIRDIKAALEGME